MPEYLYIRSNPDWIDKYKFGYTSSENGLKERYKSSITEHSEYSSYERVFEIRKLDSYKGYNEFDKIFSIACRTKEIPDNLPLLKQMKDYLVEGRDKSEFIKKEGLNLLEQIVKTEFLGLGLKFVRSFSQEELREYEKMIQREYESGNSTQEVFEFPCFEFNKFSPFPYQEETLEKMSDYFSTNDIGKIIWSCGLGKTLLSLFFIGRMKYKRVCIGTPSIFLQNQFSEEIEKFFGNKVKIIKVNGNNFDTQISNQLTFFITTYSSCHLLDKIHFDFKLGDEAHHVTTIEGEKSFSKFHSIVSQKTLYMTATEKFFENQDDKQYSMDNAKYFGKVIDRKSIKWGIENKKITDYNLVLLKTYEKDLEDLKITKEKDKNLLISSYAALKSLEEDNFSQLKHLLIYTNKIDNCERIIQCINDLIKEEKFLWSDRIKNVFKDCVTSQNKKGKINDIIEQFKNSEIGILSCVYILGEGFNLPKLTGVLIAESMESEIRIVQSCLRANRLDPENLYKESYIIIPTVEEITQENYETSKSFEKLKMIVKKFSEHDDIFQRIKIKSVKEKVVSPDDKKQDKSSVVDDDIKITNIDELKTLKLKLIKYGCIKSSLKYEENEYEILMSSNKKLSLKCIDEYNQSKNKRGYFISDPEKYFKKFGIWRNWYHFLGIDTSNLISDKEMWIKRCSELDIVSKEQYNYWCEKEHTLPTMPFEIYPNFTGIDMELSKDSLNYLFD